MAILIPFHKLLLKLEKKNEPQPSGFLIDVLYKLNLVAQNWETTEPVGRDCYGYSSYIQLYFQSVAGA